MIPENHKLGFLAYRSKQEVQQQLNIAQITLQDIHVIFRSAWRGKKYKK
jgi:hypothetical protein